MLHNQYLDGAGLFGLVLILAEFSEPMAMVAIGAAGALLAAWALGGLHL